MSAAVRAYHIKSSAPVPKEAPCYIVYGAEKEYVGGGSYGLSLKAVRRGSILFECGGGQHRVTPDAYLVINQGQQYRVSINSSQPSQAFSFFFSDQFVHEAASALSSSPEAAMEAKSYRVGLDQPFYEKLYFEPTMLQTLRGFFTNFGDLQEDPLWLREQSMLVLHKLLSVHQATVEEVQSIGLARHSTREEIYRRVHKARDFALANLGKPLALEDLANVACFSPSYFMRSFKAVFNTTPYQYIVQHRLDKAKRLLVNTEMPIGDICVEVGFQSFGAFSWFFSKKVGLSPEKYRRHVRIARPAPTSLPPL
jgi:AraC family transcriptional regulator